MIGGPSAAGQVVLELLEADEPIKHLDRRLQANADRCRERWVNSQENHHFVSPA
jgi:hypothetical protein